MLSGLSVEGKGEGIVVSAVEEGRLAHVQGNKWYVIVSVNIIFLGFVTHAKTAISWHATVLCDII